MNNVNVDDYQASLAEPIDISVKGVNADTHPLSLPERFVKRALDIVVSGLGLVCCSVLIIIAYVFATMSTGKSGIFFQERVGRNGKFFRTIKLRTMKDVDGFRTSVTTATDVRVTRVGRFLRRTKIDELPQLWNVLVGEMSLVGPRPDVPGFADQLTGTDRAILAVRPGITGPATLAFRHEEKLLAEQADVESYNREVIFPEKVRINLEYIQNYSLALDVKYIAQTLLSK